MCVCVCVCVCVHIYTMCVYVYTRGAYNKFPDFFRVGIKHCRRLLKIHYVIAYTSYEMTDQFLGF